MYIVIPLAVVGSFGKIFIKNQDGNVDYQIRIMTFCKVMRILSLS